MRRLPYAHRHIVALSTLDHDASEPTVGTAIDICRRFALHDRQIVIEPGNRRYGHAMCDQNCWHAVTPCGQIQRDPVWVAVTRDDGHLKRVCRKQPDISLVV